MKKPRYPIHKREFLGRQQRRKLVVRGGRLTRKSIKKDVTSTVADGVDLSQTPADGRRRHLPAEIAISDWMARILATGATVPANPTRPNAPWFAKIATDANANVREIADASKPYRGQIEAFARKVGLDRSCSYDNGPITLKELGYVACAMTEKRLVVEKRDEKQIKAALANIRSAFKQLIPKHASSDSVPAGATVAAALDTDGGLTSKVRSELRAALTLLESFLSDGLPPDFTPAIQILCCRFDIGGKRLAELVGTTDSTLWQWRYGRLHPTTKSKSVVNKLEKLAGLPTDALWNRCKFTGRNQRGDLQAGVATTSNSAPPAFPADWPLVRHPDTGKLGYRRPSTWPVRLARERDNYLELRSAIMCPDKMQRRGKIWRPGTQVMRDTALGRLHGFIGSELGSWAAVPHQDLCMALLISPKFAWDYVAFQQGRRELREGGDRPRLTSADKALFEMLKGLFEPRYGFLTQRPDLAAHLKPVRMRDGETESWLISPDDVVRAQSDWQGVCREAYDEYEKLRKSHVGQVKSLSSHGPIKSILELDDPLLAFRMGKAGLDAEIRMLRPGTMTYAIALRDRAVWVIQSQCAFRASTLQQLNYLSDNTGHLRDYGDRIEVRAGSSMFKNEAGPAFVDPDGRAWDYQKILEDVDGAYEAIRSYLREGLPLLRTASEQKALLISTIGHGRLAPTPAAAVLSRTYNIYVLHDPTAGTGIPGTKQVSGCHWMRHVLATGVLKLTDNEQLAADAIHDSVETVREHYVRYLPRDRAGALAAALRKGLSGGAGKNAKPKADKADDVEPRGRRPRKRSAQARPPLAGRLHRH